MNHNISAFRQSGVALILSLLILLVMTVIGVAAMNGTIMQERMAGNASTQADVFETSSEGVTRTLELFYEEAAAFEDGLYNLSCGQVYGDTDSDGTISDEGNLAWIYPQTAGDWHLASDADDNPSLEQRMYCCRSWADSVDPVTGNDVWVENPSKLFVLNNATFLGGSDGAQTLAQRQIEVELSEAEPDEPTCALCAPGSIGTVDGPNSGSLGVSGSCGAAVVTDEATDSDADATFINGVGSSAIGGFDGGIIGGTMSDPWSSPADLAEFVFWVKLGLGVEVPGQYIYGDETVSGGPSVTYGTTANPQITYIEGDGDFGGNVSGAGIMIVNGTLSWNGTPKFNGLLVSLGGSYNIDGGGSGGNYAPGGSLVMTELQSTDAEGLYDRDVLNFQVARDDDDDVQEVVMYDKSAGFDSSSDVRKASGTTYESYSGVGHDEVPPRPLLLGNDAIGLGATPELIVYAGGDNDPANNRFFLASSYGAHGKGEELKATPIYDGAGNVINYDIEVEYVNSSGVPVTGDIQLSVQPDSDSDGIPDPTRDAYGRMIPEFVLVENYPDNYGYNPNEWDWDSSVADTKFSWGSTNFNWNGGGNQNFTYDCRQLQRVKQQLLCEQPLGNLPSNAQDSFYEDPESHYSDYCWHYQEPPGDGTEGGAVGKYFEDYATTDGSTASPPTTDRPENQKAWHMWSPSCDCLGISVESDMIVSGWRENLGWRDDTGFQACDGLPSPSS